MKLRYRRVLLKLSGEALEGPHAGGIDPATVAGLARQVGEVHALGVETCLVIGGGNIYRGRAAGESGLDRVTGDTMGMLATVVNALAFRSALGRMGVPAGLLTSFPIGAVGQTFSCVRALRLLEEGRVVLCAGGTGNPFFTTDTAAALRACEIGAEALLKGTKVDGVYSDDPVRNPDAVFYETLTYREALERNLGVMDATAFALCMENRIPTVVFNLTREGNMLRAAKGESIGTRVTCATRTVAETGGGPFE